MSSDPEFADQIRKRVRDAGISLYELGERTGLDKSTLSRFVRGERWLSEHSINAIAREIGLELKKGRKR